MKFTISEAEITPARSFLEALLGGVADGIVIDELGPAAGLGDSVRAFSGDPGVAAAATSPNCMKGEVQE